LLATNQHCWSAKNGKRISTVDSQYKQEGDQTRLAITFLFSF
jgi:hypothetical protein